MNLEDHLGDIVRNVRGMSKVSAEAAAGAAGLTLEQLETLEASGKADTHLNYSALGRLIGLDGAKLEAVAKGWLPAPKDLGTWCELRCITTEANGMAVNCYLIWDEVSREAALFDTGWQAHPVERIIADNQLQLRHIFITHSHEDHVAALADVRTAFPKVRLLHSSIKNAPVDQRNRPNDFIHLGSLRIPTATRPVTPRMARLTSLAPGQRMLLTLRLSGTPSSPARLGEAINPGIRLGRKCVSRFLACRRKLCCAPGTPLTTVGEEKAHNPFF